MVTVAGATKSVPAVAAVNAPVPLPLITPVIVDTPVPPLPTANVPPSVIAPVVALVGVNPVVPAENDVTPPVDAAHVGTPPASVNTLPLVPAAKNVVTPDPVWYAIEPLAPPARFVALATAVVPIVVTTCEAVATVNAPVPLPHANPVKASLSRQGRLGALRLSCRYYD